MPAITLWDKSFSVGCEVLDEQHQQLLDLCNQLGNDIKINAGSIQNEFHEILHRLAEYSRKHFETEEEILRLHGYPDIQLQVKEHFSYCEQITNSALTIATYKTVDKLELQRFLAKWWTDHILIGDMKFREFLIEKNVT